MIRVFVLLQAMVSIAAAVCPTMGIGPVVFKGIVGAQASLLGLWLGIGASHARRRLVTTLVGLAWLALAMVLRRDFNGWELALLTLRTALVGGASWWLGHWTGYVLGGAADAEEPLPLQFQIRHLLWLTSIVALMMGTVPLIENAAQFLYVYVFLVGVGFALIPLVAFWAVFGRGYMGWRMLAFAIVIQPVAFGLSYAAYSNTGSWAAALQWLLWSTIEAAFSVLCLWWLKRLGYRTTRRATRYGPAARHFSSGF